MRKQTDISYTFTKEEIEDILHAWISYTFTKEEIEDILHAWLLGKNQEGVRDYMLTEVSTHPNPIAAKDNCVTLVYTRNPNP